MLFYAIIKIVVVFPLFYFKMFPFFLSVERAGNRIVIRCAGRLDLRPGPARRSRYDELRELLQLLAVAVRSIVWWCGSISISSKQNKKKKG